MTYELKNILEAYQKAHSLGIKTVLATVVHLEGSSYRKPGVTMLLLENVTMVGAVSGGCVEKEIYRQAESVFRNGIAKVIAYDGRYRLGCEGVLYILIEGFDPDGTFIEHFWSCIQRREPLVMSSFYEKSISVNSGFGTVFQFGKEVVPVLANHNPETSLLEFKQQLKPALQLFIIGAEHDAVQVCWYGSQTGWEVTIIAPPTEDKQLSDFKGAKELLSITPEAFPISKIDTQTAVVLMNHNYAKDLQFLLQLKETRPFYIGLLGPFKRREELLNEFIESYPEVEDAFLDAIHGPAGLNIGAETPQEIAVAIVSEILTVNRSQSPVKLKNKKGSIHS
jgi:xanthine/CO dehydrogenase XdhC/CoxF family maturation factor